MLNLSDISSGNPKGVMLTHKNMVSNIAAVYTSGQVHACSAYKMMTVECDVLIEF